jgi:integral membrane protein (TIGR01906 family)
VIAVQAALVRLLFAAAVAALLLAAAVLVFLLPPVVHLLLDLSGAPAVLGSDAATAHQLSDALVFDLLRGGGFDVPYNGEALLSAAERSHLVDVGALLRAVIAIGLLGGALLVATIQRSGGFATGAGRLLLGRALRDGALLLAGAAAAAGLAFTVAFEATFTLFHELLFATGTWTFNPTTDRLVLLYPDDFWIAASLAYCGALIGAGCTAFVIGRRFIAPPE